MERLTLVGCNLNDLQLPSIPTLKALLLTDIEGGVDLSPLADLEIELVLKDVTCSGAEKLGPGVKLIVR